MSGGIWSAAGSRSGLGRGKQPLGRAESMDLNARLLKGVLDQLSAIDEEHAGSYLGECRMPREVALLLLSRVGRGIAMEASIESLARCESPIEELFLLWLVVAAQEFPAPILSLDARPVEDYDWGWRISTQVELSGYRVDFSLEYFEGGTARRKLLIECDGHDFHERTKEQAARDKSRDRKLLLGGNHVVRYTGSEIWNDGLRCATEATEIAAKRTAP